MPSMEAMAYLAPPAETLVVAPADSSVTIRVYCWPKAHRYINLLHLQDKVLSALKNRLVEHSMTLPFPTQHILLQTLPNGNDEKLVDNLGATIETTPVRQKMQS